MDLQNLVPVNEEEVVDNSSAAILSSIRDISRNLKGWVNGNKPYTKQHNNWLTFKDLTL